jgi:hypothetical protein
MKVNTLNLVSREKRKAVLSDLNQAIKEKKQKLIARRLKDFQAEGEALKNEVVITAGKRILGPEFLDIEDIVETASKYKPVIGIYFLILDRKVVYIGQSINITSRIGHHFGVYQFDSYSFIECGTEELDLLESVYIQAYLPPLNGRTPTGKVTSPLSANSIIDMADKE